MGTQMNLTTLRSLDRAEYLGTSTRIQMEDVSPRLTLAFSVLPRKDEGEEARQIDWAAVQEANADLLEHFGREAHRAALGFGDAEVKVSEAQSRRNRLAQDLARHHRRLRQSFTGTYGETSLLLAGLDAPPVRRHLGIREQCRAVVARMRNPELRAKLGDPLVDQEALDLERLADGLEVALDAYEQALDDLTEAKKLRDEALVFRRQAERRLNSTHANVARIQEGYYRLAGLEELADRIRLTIPRPSRQEEPQPDEVPAEPPAEL